MKKKIVMSLFLLACAYALLFTAPTKSYAANASSKYAASSVKKYNGHLYQLVFDKLSWEKADSYAKSLGGHLVTITSAKEQKNVWKLIQTWINTYNDNYWIGATDKAQEGTWKWTTGETFKYTNWHSGEPNNQGGAQNYGVLNYFSDGTWDDGDDGTNAFIIEWDGYVTSFKLNCTSITMTKGGTVSLSTITTPKYGYYTSISYKSSNSRVVKVSSSGKLTAKKKGSATITVTIKANGKKYKKTCKVKVTN